MGDELATRRDRLFARRLKQAGIMEVKSLEAYDWSFNPQVPKALVLDLATARFVREHGGILLLGPPSTGKSHIAIALTVAAIHAGYIVLYHGGRRLALHHVEVIRLQGRSYRMYNRRELLRDNNQRKP